MKDFMEDVKNKAVAGRLTPARKTHLDEFAQQHNWQLNAHDDDEALHGLDSNWVEFQNRPIKRGELKEIQNLVLYVLGKKDLAPGASGIGKLRFERNTGTMTIKGRPEFTHLTQKKV